MLETKGGKIVTLALMLAVLMGIRAAQKKA